MEQYQPKKRENRASKRFKDLTIKDAFMFAAVMTDPEHCRRLLEIVLEQKILEVTVDEEKSIVHHPEYHGVRLDVLALEEGTKRRFNVEMQVRKDPELPRRSRYYHSQLDMDALETSQDYGNLPDTYVIFICDFIIPENTGEPLYRYTYTSVCRENGTRLRDGRTTIFLSTKGKNDADVPEQLVHFLKYVEDPDRDPVKADEDEFVAALKRKIGQIKQNQSLGRSYMRLEEEIRRREKEVFQEGREAGLSEGLEKGQRKGRDQANRLMAILLKEGRTEDALHAANDPKFQEQMLKEYGL